MSRCSGLHCPGCGRGGGGLVLVVIVIVVIAKALKVIESGMHTAGHVLDDLLTWTFVAVVVSGVVAASAALVWGARRFIRWRASRRLSAPLRLVDARVVGSRVETVLPAPSPALNPPPPVDPAAVHQRSATANRPPSS